ncbi:MAG: hypothetical protein KAQ69_07025 [Spirochaetales bacterium]|nr:hypothetical protein [Spirochaetales bacterium]
MSKSNLRIVAGLLMIPAFLLQHNLVVMAAQVVFLMVLAVAKGRRIKPLPITIILISVVVMNLLQVNGKVLFSIGTFSVTLGALKIGLDKALTLIGMLYVSQYMVSGKPKLPGRFGQLLSKQFLFFEYIVTSWKRPERGRFIESLDSVLETMENSYSESEVSNSIPVTESPGAVQAVRAVRTIRAGTLEIITESAFVLFMWGSFIIGFSGILPW